MFRTYFINNRGDEQMGGTWNYLDITPLGRQEEWEDSPEGYPQTPTYKWWNWHDSYVDRRRARQEMGRGVGRRRGRVPETGGREAMSEACHSNAAGAVRCETRALRSTCIVGWLALAATPTFAIMALLTAAAGSGPLDSLCSAATSPLGGMVPMYLLMSAFHSAPWLKLISGRRDGFGRA